MKAWLYPTGLNRKESYQRSKDLQSSVRDSVKHDVGSCFRSGDLSFNMTSIPSFWVFLQLDQP